MCHFNIFVVDMSLQWIAVASFLYFEIGLCLLLILPLLKSKTWKWIFSIRIFSAISPVWNTIFYSVLLVLVVLFIDSIRTMFKYANDPVDGHGITLDAKLDRLFKECRGQRNFYITGFALFLILVIRRLISMLCKQASLEASNDALSRQAAANAANADLVEKVKKEAKDKTKTDDGKKKASEEEAELTKEDYAAMEEDLKKARSDLEAMKKQAESTNREYDRLAEENQKLLNRLQELTGPQETRKDK